MNHLRLLKEHSANPLDNYVIGVNLNLYRIVYW